MSDIVLSLNCLHKFKLVHRDIKPSNLIFESDAPDSHIKLIDFCVSILQKKHVMSYCSFVCQDRNFTR